MGQRRIAPGIGLLVLIICLPQAVRAQLAPLGAPKGTLRFDIRGEFESAASRYFHGDKQDYLADFGSPALGADRLAAVRRADSLIAVITGAPQPSLNLGRTFAAGQLTIGTGTIGVSLGLTSRLTLFADFPLVSTRVDAQVKVDSTTGLAGLNPAHPRFGADPNAALFFDQFAEALDTLNARIARQVYTGNQAALAQSIATRGAQVRSALELLTRDPFAASPFLPTDTSAVGQAITSTIVGLQDTLLNSLGVNTGFAAAPVLASGPLTTTEYQALVADPQGPYAGFPLAESRVSRLGDMDIGATYTLIDRWDRSRRAGGVRLALTSLLRLPTGQRDNPANFLDVGTGNGRYELGLQGTADLGRGRIGARLTGGYLWRFATRRVRRVAPLTEPIAEVGRLTNVTLDAGDQLNLGIRPFYRLARGLAAHFTADYWHRGDDQVSYFTRQDSIPGVPASVMNAGSGGSALALGAGLSYVGRAARECQPGHKCGFPIDASWSYSVVATATGGRVLKSRITRLEIRWYQRLWH